VVFCGCFRGGTLVGLLGWSGLGWRGAGFGGEKRLCDVICIGWRDKGGESRISV
jgi:hypothetical protein